MTDIDDNDPGYDPADAATKLRALRLKAGIGLREMARRMSTPASSYSHYENPERFKDRYLPPHIAAKVASAIEDPTLKKEALRLAVPGFAEPQAAAPRIDVLARLEDQSATAKAAPANAPGDTVNTIRIAINGNLIQVAGTYDREGIDHLIDTLQKARAILKD